MNRSGLCALVRGVRALMVTLAPGVVVELGWTKRSRNDNQGYGGASRVVFIPGEFDSSPGAPKTLRGGTIDRKGAQTHGGGNPRLRTLAHDHPIVTVSVWACDPMRPLDEEGQIEATEALRELTFQALQGAVDPETGTPVGFGNIEYGGDWDWTLPPGEASFGREITFSLVLHNVPIFDQPVSTTTPQGSVARSPAT